MRARYYNIDIKRFINQDVILGSIDSSTSLNRYAYVEGNPVSYLDPFGLEKMDTSWVHLVADCIGSCAPIIVGAIILISNGALLPQAAAMYELISNVATMGSMLAYLYDMANATTYDAYVDATFGLASTLFNIVVGKFLGKTNIDDIIGIPNSGIGKIFVSTVNTFVTMFVDLTWKFIQNINNK